MVKRPTDPTWPQIEPRRKWSESFVVAFSPVINSFRSLQCGVGARVFSLQLECVAGAWGTGCEQVFAALFVNSGSVARRGTVVSKLEWDLRVYFGGGARFSR